MVNPAIPYAMTFLNLSIGDFAFTALFKYNGA